MANEAERQSGDLFIVDNGDADWKALDYLREWALIPHNSLDVATGYFDIGSLLRLDGYWQRLDKIRILMGDEVTRRTKDALAAGLASVTGSLEASIEKEKQTNDFLTGADVVVEALRSRKIECRVYVKQKFHAKAYLTHPKLAVVPPSALVGSSNFTFPGLTQNVELNVHFDIRHQREIKLLQEWYEAHWNEAEDVTPEILKVIERHTRDFSPFEIYARSLQEYFRDDVATAGDWESKESKIYPILAPYQQEGYRAMLKIANEHNGAFLCDGVGLGKTFIGLMLIERLIIHDRLNVALFVPKSARDAVWEATLKERLPHIFGRFSNLEIFNHTDLSRGGEFNEAFENVRERAHVIIIDEAHHFRNTGVRGLTDGERKSRYWRLHEIAENKKFFMLTATPVNNRLTDLQHLIELFSRHQADYFKDKLGIHSLAGHFRKMEKSLEAAMQISSPPNGEIETNLVEAERVLGEDDLFRALVVQRSRAYVKQSEDDGELLFPQPRAPQVVDYSVKQTYGKLLQMVEDAFNRKQPLFSLAIYYPYAYYQGGDDGIDPLVEGRQKQVVSLIRTQFLKRFESSVEAFTMSCWNLLRKLLAWVEVHAETAHERRQIERWKLQHKKLIGYLHDHQLELFGETPEAEAEEDIIPPEMLEAVDRLERDEFKVGDIIDEAIADLNQLADFLKELQHFKPSQDKKLSALIKLLKDDPVLRQHKVLIFTEFMDTARYLQNQLQQAGFDGIAEIDSSNADRSGVIRRFAPYYNGSSSAALAAEGLEEIRVLISTDVLSEGLNLQDATRLINYDLHWNPVRLMQRIGRVDRRMNPDIEARIIADHPDQKEIRGTAAYWNFLPPDDLDSLLQLYSRVSHKTLRISRVFGIEGKKLLRPDDDYQALKDFIQASDGAVSPLEAMRLEYRQLLSDNPGLADQLSRLPNRIFSGKEHPGSAVTPNARAVFFCYVLPAPNAEKVAEDSGNQHWTEDAGLARWYLYDLTNDKIAEEETEIVNFIRSAPATPRKVQVPAGVKPAFRPGWGSFEFC